MNWLKTTVEKTRVFVDEVVGETRKTTWPEFRELMESTAVVIVVCLLLAFYVGACDKVLVTFVEWLFTQGRV